MAIYSHSRLQTFEQCRLKFKFQYIDKISREEQSVEAFLGSRFHEVMERLYTDVTYKEVSLGELKDLFAELWEKNWGGHIYVVKPEMKPEDYKSIGLSQIENYYKRHYPFKEGNVIGLERKFLANLDEDGKYRVQCYIDRLVEKEGYDVEIHDYKTSTSMLPEQSYFDKDRQLALYEIAVRQSWPNIRNVDLIWHYPYYDKVMVSKRSEDDLRKLKKDTISLIGEVESAVEFPPSESHLCSWCSFQDICPLFSHRFKTDSLPQKEYFGEEGVNLVNKLSEIEAKKRELKAELSFLEEEQKKIEEAVFGFADQEGVSCLYGSDSKVVIKDDIKVNYPATKDPERDIFEGRLKQMGLYNELCSLNWIKVKACAKEGRWLENLPRDLAGLVNIEPIKSARLSKRKDKN